MRHDGRLSTTFNIIRFVRCMNMKYLERETCVERETDVERESNMERDSG